MAAKKTTQKAADTQGPNRDKDAKQGTNQSEDPRQQELGQSVQADSSGQDPEQKTGPASDDPAELDLDADQDVFVLVDYNPLGLKCATVATVTVAQARRLQKQGIVDTADEAVARGKGNQSTSADADQVIEDDD